MRSLAVAVIALCASSSFGGIRLASEKHVADATNAVVQEIEAKVSSLISPTDPTFSNAVLAVQIDTNTVAQIGELKEFFDGLPVGTVGTSLGGIILALLGAVAWLKKNALTDGLETDGTPTDQKLHKFFKDTNSLLTGVIDARLPYPLYAVTTAPGLLKDRALNTTSLASVTVPDDFTDLLIRASVATGGSLPVTMPTAITTKYGDTFPDADGEYLITITKTGAAEAYVRTIKLEVANA